MALGSERVRLVVLLVAVPVAFGLLVFLARLRDRWGVPRMATEPPEELHPVDLALLWSSYRHHLSPRTAYRAEIIHLARIDAIDLIPYGTPSDPEDFAIHFRHIPEAEIDRDFVRFLFPDVERSANPAPVSLRGLRSAGSGRKRIVRWWNHSFDRVALAVQQVWLDARPEFFVAFGIGLIATPLLVVSWVPHFERIGWLAIAVFLVGGFGWLVSAWALPPRLHPELRIRIQRWLAFRRYLRRFTSLRDAPAEGVVIWERYLEDAAALGMAGRVERQIRSINATSTLPSPWFGAPAGLIGATWLRHLWRRGPNRPPSSVLERRHDAKAVARESSSYDSLS